MLTIVPLSFYEDLYFQVWEKLDFISRQHRMSDGFRIQQYELTQMAER